MADFASYHNPDRMGYDAEEVQRFDVVTSKKLSGVIGSRIWLLTGDGQPRKFYLTGYFIAEVYRRLFRQGFDWQIAGNASAGVVLARKQWAVLNNEPWWKDFLASQGNFGFGVQVIRDERFVTGLEAVLTRAQMSRETQVTTKVRRRPRL